eukprot:10661215-Ditylum_brightwellii.AAC.1
MDSNLSTTSNLIKIKKRVQKRSKQFICCMKCQIQHRASAKFDRRIADIIIAINVTTKSDLSLQSTMTGKRNDYKQHKRNLDNQEKLPGGLFESTKQLQIFKHDFKVATHSRASWKSITTIPTPSGNKDLLTNFMQITEGDIKLSKANRNSDQNRAATNMYILLLKSLARPVKTAMQVHANSHNTDVPALLHHLLRQYTGTAESVICDQQLCLNNLSNKLPDLKFGVDKFCNYATETLKTLRNTGGDDKQAALKLYEALVTTKNDSFNSEIRAYKAAVAAKDQNLSFS